MNSGICGEVSRRRSELDGSRALVWSVIPGDGMMTFGFDYTSLGWINGLSEKLNDGTSLRF